MNIIASAPGFIPDTLTVTGSLNLITLPMMVFSGVFFSSSRFPRVVQPAIRLLPMSALDAVEVHEDGVLVGEAVAGVDHEVRLEGRE